MSTNTKRPNEATNGDAEAIKKARSEISDSGSVDMNTFLPLLTPPILEKLVSELLNNPNTSAQVSIAIQSHLEEAMTSFASSTRKKVQQDYNRLEKQWKNVTSDDYADCMANHLKEVTRLRQFPNSTKAAFDLLLFLAEHSRSDLDSHPKACGYGDRRFDQPADRMLLELTKERIKKEGEGEAFRKELEKLYDIIVKEATYVAAYGINGWMKLTAEFLEEELGIESGGESDDSQE